MTTKLKPVFKNAQVDDSIFSVIMGEGRITETEDPSNTLYVVTAVFNETGYMRRFTVEGKNRIEDLYPEIFFNKKPIYEQDERPVPKVDWLKVAVGTTVEVADDKHFISSIKTCEFACYVPQALYPFYTFNDKNGQLKATSLEQYKYCRFPKDFIVPEEWLF